MTKKNTIIVGGSSGIGKEIAISTSDTENVSVIARRKDRLSDLSNNYNIFTHDADVESFESLKSAIESCVNEFGKLDKMIFCAGLQIVKPHRLMSEGDFDKLFKVNLRGAYYSSKLFASSKISNPSSVFCAITSIASIKPEPGITGYSSMKAGIENLITGLAKELKPRRVVGIAPGWIETEMTSNQPIYGAKFIENLKKISPLELTELDDIVHAVDFITSDKAKSITGQTLVVDSGLSLV